MRNTGLVLLILLCGCKGSNGSSTSAASQTSINPQITDASSSCPTGLALSADRTVCYGSVVVNDQITDAVTCPTGLALTADATPSSQCTQTVKPPVDAQVNPQIVDYVVCPDGGAGLAADTSPCLTCPTGYQSFEGKCRQPAHCPAGTALPTGGCSVPPVCAPRSIMNKNLYCIYQF